MAHTRMSTEELKEHRFWDRAATEGLIDDVGGAEWMRRHAGGRLSGAVWLHEHAKLVDGWRSARAEADRLAAATRAGVCPDLSTGGTPHVSTSPPLVLALGAWELYRCDRCGAVFTEGP